MINFMERLTYHFLPIVSNGPFGEIPEDEFDKIAVIHFNSKVRPFFIDYFFDY